ncbi:MAG TPA: glycosyltransferase family 4 protein [Planctomycetes bacterium]|nr:glycosyltransferase family 4 protein [Planctomycetota bacterium]
MKNDLVVLASSFPRFPDDFAGGFLLDLARGLASLGYRLHHVVPAAAGAPKEEEMSPGVFVHRFGRPTPLFYGDGAGSNLRSSPSRIAALPAALRAQRSATARLLRETGSRLVLSHWAFPSGWVARSVVRRDPPLRHIATFHGGAAQALASRVWLRPMLRKVVASADRCVFVSDHLRRVVTGVLGKNPLPPSVVRPMGVRCDDLARAAMKARQENDEGTDDLVVAFVGRCIALKGGDLLVRAAAGLEGVRLVFVGDGPERSHWEKLARALRVSARFLGRLPATDVPAVLARADLVCLPGRVGPRGRVEGTPVSLMEAAAVGRGVVATRSGGVEDLVEDGVTGRLLPPGDVETLRGAILDCLANPSLPRRWGREALARSRRHDYTEVARCYDTLIRGLTMESGGDPCPR